MDLRGPRAFFAHQTFICTRPSFWGPFSSFRSILCREIPWCDEPLWVIVSLIVVRLKIPLFCQKMFPQGTQSWVDSCFLPDRWRYSCLVLAPRPCWGIGCLTVTPFTSFVFSGNFWDILGVQLSQSRKPRGAFSYPAHDSLIFQSQRTHGIRESQRRPHNQLEHGASSVLCSISFLKLTECVRYVSASRTCSPLPLVFSPRYSALHSSQFHKSHSPSPVPSALPNLLLVLATTFTFCLL